MSPLPSRRRVAVAVLALCVATAVVSAAAHAGAIGPFDDPDRTLVVADADSGDRLLEVPVENGTEVTLAYTHSVEKTPVRDVYVVDGDRLRMVRMEFDSYGAGLPSGADVERTEDGLVASFDRSYERVGVVPGSVAGHELVVGDDRHDLVALSNGDVVLFVADGSSTGLERVLAFEASAGTSELPAPASGGALGALEAPTSPGDDTLERNAASGTDRRSAAQAHQPRSPVDYQVL